MKINRDTIVLVMSSVALFASVVNFILFAKAPGFLRPSSADAKSPAYCRQLLRWQLSLGRPSTVEQAQMWDELQEAIEYHC